MSRHSTSDFAGADEAPRGLPGPLPEGEKLLWQGSPDWRSLAIHAFHVRKLAAYFGVLLAWLVASTIWGGTPVAESAGSIVTAFALAFGALAIVSLIAWLTGRTTRYMITDRRIVMQFGIALPMSLNIPFRIVDSAAFRALEHGAGDIPLALSGDGRAAYLMLWPHARPWRVSKPEPMLRSVPDAARVAATLSRALAAATGQAAPRTVPVDRPAAAALEPQGGMATAS